jgi:hypothetical protein
MHIAPYLEHGLMVKCKRHWIEYGRVDVLKVNGISLQEEFWQFEFLTDDGELKFADINQNGFAPVLRPLSELTKEELIEQGFHSHIDHLTHEKQNPLDAPFKMIAYLFSKHFDVFGLVEKGLAIEINELEE